MIMHAHMLSQSKLTTGTANIILLGLTVKPVSFILNVFQDTSIGYTIYRQTGHTGNIPKVVTDTARGRNPRALSVTTEGISQYGQSAYGITYL